MNRPPLALANLHAVEAVRDFKTVIAVVTPLLDPPPISEAFRKRLEESSSSRRLLEALDQSAR